MFGEYHIPGGEGSAAAYSSGMPWLTIDRKDAAPAMSGEASHATMVRMTQIGSRSVSAMREPTLIPPTGRAAAYACEVVRMNPRRAASQVAAGTVSPLLLIASSPVGDWSAAFVLLRLRGGGREPPPVSVGPRRGGRTCPGRYLRACGRCCPGGSSVPCDRRRR